MTINDEDAASVFCIADGKKMHTPIRKRVTVPDRDRIFEPFSSHDGFSRLSPEMALMPGNGSPISMAMEATI